MGDHDQGGAGLAVESEEHFLNGGTGFSIEISRGFVRKENGGTTDEGPGQSHALLLAAAELHGIVIQAAFQSHPLQQIHPRFAIEFSPTQFQGQEHVLQSRQRGHELKILKNKPHPFVAQARPSILGHFMKRLAFQENLPAAGPVQPGAESQQGGLAAAGRSDNGGGGTGSKSKGYVLQDGQGAAGGGVSAPQGAGFKNGGGRSHGIAQRRGPCYVGQQSVPRNLVEQIHSPMFIWSKLSSTKWEDAWEERFHAAANTNLVISLLPGGKRIRVDVYCHRKENALAIQKQFGGSVRELKKENWAALSAKSLKPIHVRGRLIIAHTAEMAEQMRREHPDMEVLCIPGEMAFGTGEHATTSTCLRLLVDFAKHQGTLPWDVLDLGCGTGILALAARMLGARTIEACDFDPAAITISKRNALLNKVRGPRFFRQDVLTWKPARRYDLVLANIFHDVLTVSLEKIAQATVPGGTVIMSGILKEQLPACLAAGKKAGIRFEPAIIKGKWATAQGRV